MKKTVSSLDKAPFPDKWKIGACLPNKDELKILQWLATVILNTQDEVYVRLRDDDYFKDVVMTLGHNWNFCGWGFHCGKNGQFVDAYFSIQLNNPFLDEEHTPKRL